MANDNPRVAADPETAGNKDVNVEAVVDQIRHTVAEKRRANVYSAPDLVPFSGAQVKPAETAGLRERIARLQQIGHLDLAGEPIRSHRPFLGHLVKFIKRCSRFWVRRYTDPVLLRQSHFNNEVAETLKEMHSRLEKLEHPKGDQD